MGIFDKGVQKTKQSFFEKLSRAVAGRSRVDDDVLDAIEEALVASDAGVDTTLKIIDNLEERVSRDKYMSFEELVEILRDEIGKLLSCDGSVVRQDVRLTRAMCSICIHVCLKELQKSSTMMRLRHR